MIIIGLKARKENFRRREEALLHWVHSVAEHLYTLNFFDFCSFGSVHCLAPDYTACQKTLFHYSTLFHRIIPLKYSITLFHYIIPLHYSLFRYNEVHNITFLCTVLLGTTSSARKREEKGDNNTQTV